MEAIPLTFLLLWAGLAGLVCGSFANVLAYRIPRGVFFRMGSRSHCPLCGDPIPWWDNIPLLSFFLLGGRCRSCKGPIPVRYPLVEGLCGLLFTAVAWRAWGPPGLGTGYALLGFLLSLWLTAASVIDLEHRILPDSLTLPGIPAAPFLALLSPFGLGWPQDLFPRPWGVVAAGFAGVLAGGGIPWLTGVLGKAAFRKEAMGMGDVKFLAFLGGLLGPLGVLAVFFLASLFGAFVGIFIALARRDHYLPFGPFLAGAAWTVILGRDILTRWGERLMEGMVRGPEISILLLALTLAAFLGFLVLRKRKGGTGMNPDANHNQGARP